MTLVRDLTARSLADRLGGKGLPLDLGPFVARLGTTLPELTDAVHLLYGGFPIVDDEPMTDFEIRVEPARALRRWIAPRAVAYVDGQRSFAPFPRRHALPMFEWAVNWCTFSRPSRHLLLHAAVVERHGWGLLLPGRPGSGKSTLAAGLVLRGWRLLSDELAVVPSGEARVLPVPRPVGLKDGSIPAIARLDPGAVIGPSTPGTRKGTVAHMRPTDDSVSRRHEPARVRAIVFPRFESGAETVVGDISRPEAFLRVAQESFNYSVLGSAGFETLAAIVDPCSCHTLHHGDLEAAIDAIEEIVSASDARSTAAPVEAPR